MARSLGLNIPIADGQQLEIGISAATSRLFYEDARPTAARAESVLGDFGNWDRRWLNPTGCDVVRERRTL